MEPFSIAWYLWLAAFAIIEGIALFNKKKGDTLSEHVWKWFAVKNDGAKLVWPRRIVLWSFLGWLVTHFVTGGLI